MFILHVANCGTFCEICEKLQEAYSSAEGLLISVMSLISTAIVASMDGESNQGFNYTFGFMGLIFFCISEFFNYGTELEKEVDGLV